MTDVQFLEGWAVLLAQPYGREYVLDPAREATQRRLYQEKFGGLSAEVWSRAVDAWVSHKTHWPCIPELLALVRTVKPKIVADPYQPKLSDAPHIPLSTADIHSYSVEHQISFFEAVRQWETIYQEKMAGKEA